MCQIIRVCNAQKADVQGRANTTLLPDATDFLEGLPEMNQSGPVPKDASGEELLLQPWRRRLSRQATYLFDLRVPAIFISHLSI